MNIRRKRWVIIRNTDTGQEVFCGLARHFKFKSIDNIGDTSVKTYLSKNKAISSFESSWEVKVDGEVYRAIEVEESIVLLEE